jgi:hypothetical protein
MSEFIISRSFSALARWVNTRIPTEQTFSVVVRSAVAGSKTLEICNWSTSRIRFSSLPDRADICEMTFENRLSQLAPGCAAPKRCTSLQEFQQRPISKAHIAC